MRGCGVRAVDDPIDSFPRLQGCSSEPVICRECIAQYLGTHIYSTLEVGDVKLKMTFRRVQFF